MTELAMNMARAEQRLAHAEQTHKEAENNLFKAQFERNTANAALKKEMERLVNEARAAVAVDSIK